METNQILENKSVNDRVNDLTKYVGNCILNDTKKVKLKKSPINFLLYKENTFTVNIDNLLKEGNILTIHYIMYCFESQKDYSFFMTRMGNNGNSEADEDTNTITIVSGFIENKTAYDFYGTISHELNHLFQYGMGMEKRKDLYDKAVELIHANDMNSKIVGTCAYYSFKHEQDAFAHQYYSQLMQNKPKSDIETLFFDSPFRQMNIAYNKLIKIKNNPSAIKQMNYLGFSKKDFVNYVRYRRKRFNTKIRNVITKYLNDINNVTEWKLQKHINGILNLIEESEKHGYEIKWCIESIYDFSLR